MEPGSVVTADLLQEGAHGSRGSRNRFPASFRGVDRPLPQAPRGHRAMLAFVSFQPQCPQLKASSENSINIFSLILNPNLLTFSVAFEKM